MPASTNKLSHFHGTHHDQLADKWYKIMVLGIYVLAICEMDTFCAILAPKRTQQSYHYPIQRTKSEFFLQNHISIQTQLILDRSIPRVISLRSFYLLYILPICIYRYKLSLFLHWCYFYCLPCLILRQSHLKFQYFGLPKLNPHREIL